MSSCFFCCSTSDIFAPWKLKQPRQKSPSTIFARSSSKSRPVKSAEAHPNADKLLVLQIDLGGEQRQICAGIRNSYTPEELVGKQIVVVANLETAKLRGLESQGMLLAASDNGR
jgi:methionine--tRNA ligase beta chain